ncbi:MAG: hypothetical protein AAB533_03605 [Patescibacteria group bacterium]
MDELISKKIKVVYAQEAGWKRPVKITAGKKEYAVRKVVRRWEEHTLEDSWWRRRHRVHYAILLDDGAQCEIYWDRGASGKRGEWILRKKLT